MIVIIGNNLNCMILAAYCEQEHVDYRWYYTQKINQLPFYFNDYEAGMFGKLRSYLKVPISEPKLNNNFYIDSQKLKIPSGMTIESFCESICSNYTEKQSEIRKFISFICDLGQEWKKIVDANFDLPASKTQLMSRNFMNSFEDTLKKQFNCKPVEKLFLSLVPRKDISLNTASGYIYNQLFDGSQRSDLLHEYIDNLWQSISPEKKNNVASFKQIKIDRKKKEITYDDKTLSYNLLITAVDTEYHANRLRFFKLNCKDNFNVDWPVFLVDDEFEKLGVSQAILWKNSSGYQLDLYYYGEKVVDETEISKWLKVRLPNFTIVGETPYDQLINEYGIGNFSGWAFSVKDTLRNPLNYKGKKEINLADWGIAFFTSSLLGIKYINEERRG